MKNDSKSIYEIFIEHDKKQILISLIVLFVCILIIIIGVYGFDNKQYDFNIQAILWTIAGTVGIISMMWLWISLGSFIHWRSKAEIGVTQQDLETQERWSGKIALLDRAIVFTQNGQKLLHLPLDEVKIIGELTLEAEPAANDWFLIFLSKEQKYKIPAYAVGMQVFLNELSQQLDYQIVPRLCSSTKLASKTIYPKQFENIELFRYEKAQPKNLWERILAKTGLSVPMVECLNKPIAEYLDKQD